MFDVTGFRDDVLVHLQCNCCKNFLSVAPILMDAYGNNICGRCKNKADDSSLIHNIFYENLAYWFSFPCRFLSDGCLKKDNFIKIEAHEATCPYEVIKCQTKNCAWFGTRTGLILHYYDSHQEFIIENDCLKEISEDEGCFMLTISDINFQIKWSYCDFMFELCINPLHILDSDNDILFKCTLSTVSPIKCFEMIKSLKASTTTSACQFHPEEPTMLPVLFSINIELPENIILKTKEDLKKILCPICSDQMIPPILKCIAGHITCVECTTYNYDYCQVCREDNQTFSRVPELEYIAANSIYTCTWAGCESKFTFRELQEHEHSCPKRMYMCWYCQAWEGLQYELLSHNMACEKNPEKRPLTFATEATFLGTAVDSRIEQSFIAYNELFDIMIETKNEIIEVSVRNLGRVSEYGWYHYQAELQHVEDINFPFNKTYNLLNKDDHTYFVEVPSRDICNFNGCNFFQITVKIILLEGNERISNTAMCFKCFK